MCEIKFENLSDKYVEQVFAIERDSIPEFWSMEQISALTSNPNALARIGLIDGDAICYYSMNVVAGEGYINNLAVKEAFRGKGIGSALIWDIITAARDSGITALTLEVNENNTPAIALYNKFGFCVEGRRPKFYAGKDAALIMWKRDIR